MCNKYFNIGVYLALYQHIFTCMTLVKLFYENGFYISIQILRENTVIYYTVDWFCSSLVYDKIYMQ